MGKIWNRFHSCLTLVVFLATSAEKNEEGIKTVSPLPTDHSQKFNNNNKGLKGSLVFFSALQQTFLSCPPLLVRTSSACIHAMGYGRIATIDWSETNEKKIHFLKTGGLTRDKYQLVGVLKTMQINYEKGWGNCGWRGGLNDLRMETQRAWNRVGHKGGVKSASD